ncbi:hypothetical protein D3C77_678030 [compost metagenome]
MLNGYVVDPGERRIDGGIPQGLGIDIDGSDLRMAGSLGNEQGTDATTTADVHSMLNRLVAVL